MIISNKLSSKQISDVKTLQKICEVKRVPCFDSSIFIDNEIKCFYLKYEDNNLVSFLALFYVDPKEIEILGFTHPDYRKKGYFSALRKEAKKAIPKEVLILYQIPDNYENSGFASKYKYHHGEEQLICVKVTKPKHPLLNLSYSDIGEASIILSEAFDSTIKEEKEFLERQLLDNTTTTLVYKENNKVIGLIATSSSAYLETLHLYAFCVAKELRGKGYGSKMLKNLPFNEFGYELRVDIDNIKARKLYLNSGFKHLSTTMYYS